MCVSIQSIFTPCGHASLCIEFVSVLTTSLFIEPRSPKLWKTSFGFTNNAWMQDSSGRNLHSQSEISMFTTYFFLRRGIWQQFCFVEKPLHHLINLLWRLTHWLVSGICLSCITTIPAFMSHFSHGHLILAQTMESSRFGRALINLGLGWKLSRKQISNPQKL